MKILTFYDEAHTLQLGLAQEDKLLDVAKAAAALNLTNVPTTPNELYQTGFAGLEGLQQLLAKMGDISADVYRAAATVEMGPAVPNPSKIVCVGLNYRRHAEESNMAIPSEPVLFSKFNNAIAAPEQTIALPPLANEYDYEAEIAFVIGRRAKHVPLAEALDCVLGYCNVNDVSSRDLQFRTGQWLIGKTLDDFLPVGPYLVTADEIPDPQNLTIRCWRNGQLVQDSNTSDMIFTIAEIIAHISQLITLEPGDLVITGTPEGVILGAQEKVWLQDGEETVVEVEGLGRLRNTFARVS